MKGRCPRPLDERDTKLNILGDVLSLLLYKPYQSVWTLIVTHLSSLFKSESKLSVSYKEVIQRQVPLALPCYDFTPVMNHKVVSVLPKVKLPTSFAAHSHGVTGGVYKARERIHRCIADQRLLAIPPSCRRVAAYNPNLERVYRLASLHRFASYCHVQCSTCVAQGVRGMLT